MLKQLEEGSTRGEERLVGRSAAGAAVGVAEDATNELCVTGLLIPHSPHTRLPPHLRSDGYAFDYAVELPTMDY